VLILGRDVIYYVGKEWQTQLETAPDIFFLLPSLHEASPLYKTAKGGQGR
jgi:hypothetical protein